MDKSPLTQSIVFYDEECLFCNHQIKRLHRLTKDQKNLFFAGFNSSVGKILSENDRISKSSLILAMNNKMYYGADAIEVLARDFFKNPFYFYILKPIPKWIKKKVYDSIAKRRNSLKKETCEFDSELQNRILK